MKENKDWICEITREIRVKILKEELTPEDKAAVRNSISRLSEEIRNDNKNFTHDNWKELYICISLIINDIQKKNVKNKNNRETLETLLELIEEVEMKGLETSLSNQEWGKFKKRVEEELPIKDLEELRRNSNSVDWEEVARQIGDAVKGIIEEEAEKRSETRVETRGGKDTQLFGSDGTRIVGTNRTVIIPKIKDIPEGQSEEERSRRNELFVELEQSISKITDFDKFKEFYTELQNLKKNLGANGLEEKWKDSLETILEQFIEKLKNNWIKLYPERAKEILEYCAKNSKEEPKDTKEVLVLIEKRLKVVSYGHMSNAIAQEVVDRVVQATNVLLADPKLSDTDLNHLFTIYDNAEGSLKITEETEYLQMAIGFMTQIIEEKQEDRRKVKGYNQEEAENREIQSVNEKLEEILKSLEQVIVAAQQKKKIKEGVLISIESKGLLEQKKLTPEQIERLFNAYARAKEVLEGLDEKTKKQPAVKKIIDTATEFQKKREIAAGIKYDPQQAADVKENERKKQLKEIEKKIKIREEIEQILKKFKSNIKKFILAYEKVLEISVKYGEKIDTYKKISESIKELDEKILRETEEINRLRKPKTDETLAEKTVRLIELEKRKNERKKLRKERKNIGKDIKTYNEAFKTMKSIRTTIAEEVSSSNEYSKSTKEYINQKSKSNQTFYGLTKEKQAEKDFEVSQEEIDEVKTKAEEVRWLKYEEQPEKEGTDGKKGKNKDTKKAAARSEETTSSTTQRGGGKEEVRGKSKFKALKDKLFKSKKAKDNDDVDYEVDEYKKIELRNLSDELKKKMILEYYKNKGKDRFFGGIWARFKAFTSKGKAEWEREFLRKEVKTINPDQAAEYRKNMADAFHGRNHIKEVAARPIVNGKVDLGNDVYLRDD